MDTIFWLSPSIESGNWINFISVANASWYHWNYGRTQHKAATINQLACPSYSFYVQLLWYPMYYPRGMKARVSSVQLSKPYSILAPTQDSNPSSSSGLLLLLNVFVITPYVKWMQLHCKQWIVGAIMSCEVMWIYLIREFPYALNQILIGLPVASNQVTHRRYDLKWVIVIYTEKIVRHITSVPIIYWNTSITLQ